MSRDYETKFSGVKQEYASGATRDNSAGKGKYVLVPPTALRRLAGVYERGAKNHGSRNWEKGFSMERGLDSAIRHIFQHLEGMRDEDHLAQAAWNLFAVMHFEDMIDRGLLPKELNDLPNYLARKEEPPQKDYLLEPEDTEVSAGKEESAIERLRAAISGVEQTLAPLDHVHAYTPTITPAGSEDDPPVQWKVGDIARCQAAIPGNGITAGFDYEVLAVTRDGTTDYLRILPRGGIRSEEFWPAMLFTRIERKTLETSVAAWQALILEQNLASADVTEFEQYCRDHGVFPDCSPPETLQAKFWEWNNWHRFRRPWRSCCPNIRGLYDGYGSGSPEIHEDERSIADGYGMLPPYQQLKW